MTETRKRLSFSCCFASLLVLSGCATNSGNQHFSMSLLPPAPKQAVAASVVDSVQVSQPVTVSESPVFLKASVQMPPKPSQVDMRIRRVDERFSAGRKAYQEGDLLDSERRVR